MLRPVFRAGDQVVFRAAHQHPRGDTRSFLVEEVIQGHPEHQGPHARIHPLSGLDPDWKVVSVDSLKHDPMNEPGPNVQYIDAVIAPGYCGNPDAWCWWEAEYPEEGAIGGYHSRELALEGIRQNELDNNDTVHFHVVEDTSGKYQADARRRGRAAWSRHRRGGDTIEAEVAALKERLARLENRVRLTRVAERFLAGNREIRVGDYFLLYADQPTRLTNISSEGKWTYFDGRNVVEPFRIPSPGDYERLYTHAEVAEIVTAALKGNTSPEDK